MKQQNSPKMLRFKQTTMRLKVTRRTFCRTFHCLRNQSEKVSLINDSQVSVGAVQFTTLNCPMFGKDRAPLPGRGLKDESLFQMNTHSRRDKGPEQKPRSHVWIVYASPFLHLRATSILKMKLRAPPLSKPPSQYVRFFLHELFETKEEKR